MSLLQSFRFSHGLGRTARSVALIAAVSLTFGSAGTGTASAAGPAAGTPADPGQLPVQRQSQAGGQAEVGKNLNNVIPPSLRSQYPLRPITKTPPSTIQPIESTEDSTTALRGFDPGSSKEIPTRRSRFEQVFANRDGTQTTAFSQVPVNYQRPDGSWAPIDNTLRRDPLRGDWVTSQNTTSTRISSQAKSGPEMVTVAFDADHEIAWGLQGVSEGQAIVSGDEARFRDVARDADLQLNAKPDGVKESIVVRSTAAPSTYFFPLRLKGLTATLADNQVSLIDQAGVSRGVIPPGHMVDADQAASAGVRYSLVDQAGGGQALRVDIDPTWVRDPSRVFPITVDPTVAAASSLDAITVREHDVLSGNDTLQIGCRPPDPDSQDCTRPDTQRGNVYLSFTRVTQALAHERILGAQLSLLNFDSGSCSPREVSIHPVLETWSLTNATWPGPAIGPAVSKRAFNHGYIKTGQSHSACPFKQEVFDLYDAGRKVIQGWVDGTSPNYGLAVRASSPNDKAAWKKFTGTVGQANPPRLYITHTPYDATYKYLATPAPVQVTPSTAGRYTYRVTNKSATDWKPGDYYLGYRVFDGRTRALIDAATPAASLTATVPRNGSVNLSAVVQPLAGEVNGRPYIVEFSMVDAKKNRSFADEGVAPDRANITVYNTPPTSKRWWPVNGYQAATLRPTFAVTASDLETPPSGLTYKFEVCESVPGNDRLNCFFSGTGTSGSYGTASSWTATAGKLSWNKTYKWRVYVKDSGGVNEPLQPSLTLLTQVPQPVLTSRLSNGPTATADHDFDPQAGNYTTAVTDATVPVAGPTLEVTRTYNSLDPRRGGAFGAGWSTKFDMNLKQEGSPGNALLTYPDGQQVRFGLNPDGKWVAPSDRKATLVKDSTGWTLRVAGTTSYHFDLNGRLVQVSESGGKPLVLAYDASGLLTTATSLAGGSRKLIFGWANGHVATVSTDAVGGAPLVWNYTYDADKLTKVCDPRGSCTTYEFGKGSHYSSAVLDSRPESYWRLGDDQDDPAVSEVDINLHEDDGAYRGSVGYGATGVVAGSDDKGVYLGATGFASIDVKKSLFRRMSDGAVEVWFKTNSGVTRPLLGYQNKALGTASTAGMPILYIGSDGKLRGQFWNGTAAPIASASAVNNDQWHHAVLSAEGTKQTLYLDGAVAGTVDGGRVIQNDFFSVNQWGAAYAARPSDWPAYGTTAQTSYGGSMDEAAVYTHPLSLQDVAQHYFHGRVAADQLTKVNEPSGKVLTEIGYDTARDRLDTYTDDDGGTWKLSPPVTDGGADDLRRTVTVTDPANRTWFYEYDALGGWLLRSGRPNGLGVRPEDLPLPDEDGEYDWNSLEGMVIRSYTHNTDGKLTKLTDERGAEQRYTYDDRGNITSETSCRQGVAADCHTSYTTYQAGLMDPLDPRWDLPLVTRDGRSSSATDNTYATTQTYTVTGALASVTAPGGLKTTYTYTTGSEAAVGGGTMPGNLLRTQTDQRGAVTTNNYDSSGLLAEVVAPSGMRTSYSADVIGRRTSETTKVAGRPDATTTYEYDKSSRITAMTGPRTTDSVTGADHQQRSEFEYDLDGNVQKMTTKDVADSSVEPRITTRAFDDHNRLAKLVDPDGGETSHEYDHFGNPTSLIDARGNHYDYAYTARNMLAEVRLFDADSDGQSGYAVIESRGYDQAGRQVRQGDALGRNVRFEYYDDNTVKRSYLESFHNPDGSTRNFDLSRNTYDGAGNLITQTTDNGATVEMSTLDPAGRITQSVINPGSGPGIVSRTSTYSYDAGKGDLIMVSSTGTSSGSDTPAQTMTTEYAYDATTGQVVEQRIQASAAPDPAVQQVTRWTYDQTGSPLTATQPRGNTTATADDSYTTKYTYDVLGRQVKVEAPPVAAEANGGAPAIGRPTSLIGYDAFGSIASTKDPLGNVTKAIYNNRGWPIEVTAPSYTPPSGGAAVVPTVKTSYDEGGNPTAVVDERGNVTRYTYDRQGHRIKVDAPTKTNDDRAVWSYSYLHNGLTESVTDPSGAKQQWTYDDLDRQITATQVERMPSLMNLTTKTAWNDRGDVTSMTSPTGAVAASSYDSLGQMLKATDPNGVASTFGYDSAGRQVSVTDGLGRSVRTSYDLAGRLKSQTRLDKDGNQLGTARFGYDLDDNLTTSTTASQHTTTYAYDALGRINQMVEPVSAAATVTSTYGYDAAGNTTRVTDGRGNATLYSTNSLGLPEKVIEPSTAAHPNLADRTWTASYDVAGNPVVLDAPGGVRQTRTFDAANRLVRADGTGAQAATASRVLGYDDSDQLVSMATSTGDNTYTYNDRGQLLTANGPSGDASYDYDGDGHVTKRVDAAGTADFTYTKGRLATVTDPVTRTLETIGYNTAGQLASIDYGAGRLRTIGYDAFGRTASDTVKNNAGQVVASIGYGYDADDQITRKTTSGVEGAGNNAYTFDYLGRLSTWTLDGQTTEYGWDAASNRTSVKTSAGTKTATYDERNRLLSDGTSTYTYSARGTMSKKTASGSTLDFSFDAFDRLIQQGTKTIAYDSLDRPLTSGVNTFKYAGLGAGAVSDGNQTYGQGLDGDTLSVGQGATKRLALSDLRGDVVGGFDPADSVLSSLPDSRSFDPFGEVSAATGTKYGVGYQGDWTDPAIGQVNMGARWYDPASSTFTSRDSIMWPAGTGSARSNLFAYAGGDPVNNTDPDGHIYIPLPPPPAWELNPGQCNDDSWSCLKPPSNSKNPPSDGETGGGKTGGGKIGGGKTGGGKTDGGGDDDGGGHRPPPKPKCDAKCQAAKKHQKDVARTNRTKKVIKTYVTTKTVATPGVQDPHCVGGNAACPRYTGAPSTHVGGSQSFDDRDQSSKARDRVVQSNGEIQTNATDNSKLSFWDRLDEFGLPGSQREYDLGTNAYLQNPAAIHLLYDIAGLIPVIGEGFDGANALLYLAEGDYTDATLSGASTIPVAGWIPAGAKLGKKGFKFLFKGGTEAAEKEAKNGLQEAAEDAAKAGGDCSFTGETPVLLKDGSTKPIAQLQVGDSVKAADPETGESGSRTVTNVWVHQDTIVQLRTDKGAVTTTDNHPFWDESDHRFERADQLDPGDKLLTADNRIARVIGLTRNTDYAATVYNLTVDDLHTYYVVAGATPILVHNCGPGKLSDPLPPGMSRNVVKAYDDIRAGNGVPRIDPRTGSQKVFAGKGAHEKKWAGALEFEVPGTRGNSYRILMKELPDGRKVMGWTNNHYDTINPFKAPHFPDSGW
jgi:RHS repeat-associated protein